MSDLIERLRNGGKPFRPDTWDAITTEAADALEAKDVEIERLRADKTKWILRCGIVDAENKRLRAELKATQDNEHRIVEANKLVLIRNAKLQAVVDAAISWANTDQNDIDGCDKTALELLDAVLEYEMSVAALDTVDEQESK